MAGKEKRGPRTKGNLKPSSSGRSAELLGNPTAFVGFGGLQESSYVPLMNFGSHPDDSELNIPAEFRLTLRKMGKKDSTTKIKALQEFEDLCEKADVDTLRAVLPFWPRLFCRLAVDGDKRVRDNLHKAHGHLATKMGRYIAPCLKELMGAWFCSQCDVYAPAASSASQSLNSCFPGCKLSDAVTFCHNEIVDYIGNSLFHKDDDLLEDQRERILVGALGGYSLLLQRVEASRIVNNEVSLLKHTNLWKSSQLYKLVGKDSDSIVQSSWFSMVCNMLHFLPQAIQENSGKLVNSILLFLNDERSSTLPTLWEVILKLLATVESDSSYASLSTSLIPKLSTLLRSACFGNCCKIGPLVIPLVKRLREGNNRQQEFDRQIIESLCQGLLSRGIANSPSEASAFAAVLFQGLGFFLQDIQETTVVEELFQNAVTPAIDSLIKSQSSDGVLAAVCRRLAQFFYDMFDSNEAVASVLWQFMESCVTSTLMQPPHPDQSVVKRVGVTVSALLNPSSKIEHAKKALPYPSRIKFADLCPNDSSERACTVSEVQLPGTFGNKINQLCVIICQRALECSKSSECHACICLLVSVMHNERASKAFLTSNFASPMDVISDVVQPMLKKQPDGSGVSLLFSVINYIDSDQRLLLLENIIKDESVCVALATTAMEKFPHLAVALEWLHGPQVAKLLISVAEQLVTSTSGPHTQTYWNLVRIAFKATQGSGNALLLPEGHLDGVLRTLAAHLAAENMEDQVLDDFIVCAWEVLQTASDFIYSLESAPCWLDGLIGLLCSPIRIHPETMTTVLKLWVRGATFAVSVRCHSASSLIKKTLLMNPTEEVTDRLAGIFQCVATVTDNEPDAIQALVRQIVPTAGEWRNWTNESNACHLMAKEFLCSGLQEFSGDRAPSVPTKFRPVQVAHWSGLVKVATVTSTILVRHELVGGVRLEIMPYLYYAMAAADVLLHLCNKVYKDSALSATHRLNEVLKTNTEILLARCSSTEQSGVCQRTRVNSSQHFWIWSLAARRVYDACKLSYYRELYNCNEAADSGNLDATAQWHITKLISLDADCWSEGYRYLPLLRSTLSDLKGTASADTAHAITRLVEMLQMWQVVNNDQFLFGVSLEESLKATPVTTTWTVVEAIRLLSVIVQYDSMRLTQTTWDFILCSMSSWCSTLEESWAEATLARMKCPLLLSFTVAVGKLIHSCASLFDDACRNKTAYAHLPADLTAEWNDVFTEVAYSTTISVFMRLTKHSAHARLQVYDYLMEALACSFHYASDRRIEPTLDHLCPLLLTKQSPIQFAAYNLILKLLPNIVSNVNVKEEAEGSATDREPPEALLAVLQSAKLGELDKVRTGDLHVVEPYSAECIQLVSYFLTWGLVIRLCGHSNSELRYQYSAYLSNSGLLASLMNKLFCIIPHAAQQQVVDLHQQFLVDAVLSETVIQQMATHLYANALKYLPAVVRRWCNNTDKRTASLVEKFTSRCISPALMSDDLKFCSKTWDNMTIRVRTSAREIVATYKLNDEGSMELIIQLPINYPLGNITVDSGKKVGVTSSQWRNWLLQLTTFLIHQNGSIVEGLALWKKNVDKRFEGIEECYICYYVLHGSNYQLPKLSCRTCKKKFHADCLYKWFSTSNNSTCPLCRNLF